jgi:hypothetical protein
MAPNPAQPQGELSILPGGRTSEYVFGIPGGFIYPFTIQFGFFCFLRQVSLCSPGWSGTPTSSSLLFLGGGEGQGWDLNLGLHACKAVALSLEPRFQSSILLSQPPKCWDYRLHHYTQLSYLFISVSTHVCLSDYMVCNPILHYLFCCPLSTLGVPSGWPQAPGPTPKVLL